MDQGIVIDSVRKMLSSGLDAQTIKYTLLDLGLSEREADDALTIAQGKAPSPASPVSPAPVEKESPFVKSPTLPVYESVSNPVPASNSISQQVLASTTATQLAMDEHKDQLAEVHASVSDLHEKVDSISSSVSGTASADVLAKLSLLSNRLSALEHEITDLKAQGSGLQSLLSKVLETNRDVLLELQRRPTR